MSAIVSTRYSSSIQSRNRRIAAAAVAEWRSWNSPLSPAMSSVQRALLIGPSIIYSLAMISSRTTDRTRKCAWKVRAEKQTSVTYRCLFYLSCHHFVKVMVRKDIWTIQSNELFFVPWHHLTLVRRLKQWPKARRYVTYFRGYRFHSREAVLLLSVKDLVWRML